ncbi:MAG: hypothetical protein OSB42_08555 [Planctomycetota bacterium]|nr:hypothetical protein [Planctomycetota bacterium]
MFHRKTPPAIAPLIGLIVIGLAVFAIPQTEGPQAAERSVPSPLAGFLPGKTSLGGQAAGAAGNVQGKGALAISTASDQESDPLRFQIVWSGCGFDFSFSEKDSLGLQPGFDEAHTGGRSPQGPSGPGWLLWELDTQRLPSRPIQADRRTHPAGISPSVVRYDEGDRHLPDPSIMRLLILDQATGTIPQGLEVAWLSRDGGWQQMRHNPRGRHELHTVEPGPIRLRIAAHGYFGIETEVDLSSGLNELLIELNAMVRADLTFIGRSGQVPVDLDACDMDITPLGRQGSLRMRQGQSLFFTTDGPYRITISGIEGYAPVTFEVLVTRETPLTVRIPLHGR